MRVDKSAKKRVSAVTGMHARTYQVFCRALEEGITCGYRRAFKHTDIPSEEDLKECIFNAVLNEVCEVFSFDNDV